MTELTQFNTPGHWLRRAREAAKLTQQDVAGHLYLPIKVIHAIENDDFTSLPGIAFIKGYLRAYANLLNLPVDAVLQAFNDLGFVENKKEKYVQQVPLYRTDTYSRGRYTQWATYGIVFGLLLLVFLWWQNRSTQVLTPAFHRAVMTPLTAVPVVIPHYAGVVTPLLMPEIFDSLYPQIGLQFIVIPTMQLEMAFQATQREMKPKKRIRRQRVMSEELHLFE